MQHTLLADIGNTHIHIFDGHKVIHLPHFEALDRYSNETINYICVNSTLTDTLSRLPNWHDISPQVKLKNAYDTMGIDRQVLCLGCDDGLLIDAGSAITVDIMEGGEYMGGFILEGVAARLLSYRSISPALQTELNTTIDLSKLPMTTKDGISYGIIASIKSAIELHTAGRKLYFTGGDGRLLASFFEGSIYSDRLVFEGMQRVLKGYKC